MNLTKQHALYVDFALGFYMLFAKSLSIKNKTGILISLFLAGILSLFIMLPIPGLKLLTIDNLKNMSYWSINEIISEMNWTIKSNKFCFAFLTIFFIQFFAGKIKLDKLEAKWFLVALFFAFFQILGGIKRGGNGGNYEVALIPLIPFAAISFSVFCNQFKEAFFTQYAKKIFISLLSLILCMNFFNIANEVFKYREKLKSNEEVIKYLNEKIGKEKIMYFSNDYMILSRSSIVPEFDCLTIPYWCKDFYFTLQSALKKQEFKYLLIDQETFKNWDSMYAEYFKIQANSYDLLHENYELVSRIEENLPEELAERLFIAKFSARHSDFAAN